MYKYTFDNLEKFIKTQKPYSKEKLLHILKSKEEVFIYGAGSGGTTTLKWLESNTKIEILGFIDSDLKKQKRIIEGKKVYSLDQIPKHCAILIASTYYNEISKILNKKNYNNFLILPIDLMIWDKFETIEHLKNNKKEIYLKEHTRNYQIISLKKFLLEL